MSDEDELAALRSRVVNLERYAKSVAHELSAPLTTAHGFTQLLLDEEHSPATRDSLDRVARAVDRAQRTVRRMLDEVVGQEPRPVRPVELVGDLVTSLAGRGVALRVSMTSEVPVEPYAFVAPAPARAMCDALVAALVEHAAGAGSARLEVTTGHTSGGTVDVLFRLDGTGLTPAMRSHARHGNGAEAGVAGLLRDVADRAASLGGKLWLDEDVPGHDGGVTVLLGLPRFTERDHD